jgi:inner membrane protein involved in colicin E2 resistance
MELVLWIIAIVLIIANLDSVLIVLYYGFLLACILAGIAAVVFAIVTWPQVAAFIGVLVAVAIVASDLTDKSIGK